MRYLLFSRPEFQPLVIAEKDRPAVSLKDVGIFRNLSFYFMFGIFVQGNLHDLCGDVFGKNVSDIGTNSPAESSLAA